MVWYNDLYADESIIRKKEKIKWKVCHNVGQINMYLITLSHGSSNLLEIVSTLVLMQSCYPKEHLFVVGVAKGYDQAVALSLKIVMEVYEATGSFDVKTYLRRKQKAGNGQVSICP